MDSDAVAAARRRARGEALDRLYESRRWRSRPVTPLAGLVRKERLAAQRRGTAGAQVTDILREECPALFASVVSVTLNRGILRLKMKNSADLYQMDRLVRGPIGFKIKQQGKGLVNTIRVCQ